MSKISEFTPISEDIQRVVDEKFINQLRAHGPQDQFSAKEPSDQPDTLIKGFFSLSILPQVILIQTTLFENSLKYLPNRAHPLDLVQE